MTVTVTAGAAAASVLIVQPYVPAYRVPLFEALRQHGAARGIEVAVVAGEPPDTQARRGDSVTLEWATRVRSWSSPIPALPLRIKALSPGLVRNADLVVGELSAGAAENWPLALGRRMCLWGHGYRAVGGYSRVDDVLETVLLRRTRHFFAYTERGRDSAVARGVPEDRITVLWNTVDTAEIIDARARIGQDEIDSFRRRHDLADGPALAFIGGLDAAKRIDFLLRATLALRTRIPDLRLLIAGDGVARAEVVQFVRENPWARWLGRVDSHGKALLGATCALLLNPGRVGLIAVDSFALGTPIATTRWHHHAPEFDYLNDRNAVITDDALAPYVEGIDRVLGDPDCLATLRRACTAAVENFSIDAMAHRYLDGIERALSL